MKRKKWVIAFLAVIMSLTTLIAIAACKPEETEAPTKEEGPETGVYYYDAGTEEYQIALNNGDAFTFLVMGENKTGTYTLTGETLELDFARAEDTDLTATLSGDVLTLTYEDASMRFLKKIAYTVTFDAQEGSAVAAETVMNGKTVAKPVDPVREGYVFVGWYTDAEHTMPFLFGTQPVTSDVTLYAYWLAKAVGTKEYTVDFDLGYEGEAPAAVETIAGCVVDLPVPEREGYTFLGWYVSAYDDAARLTYEYTAGTALRENTTLYALWREEGAAGLAAPEVSVTSTGVTWEAVSGAKVYTVRVSGPDGYERTYSDLQTTSQAVDFSVLEAGDYEVTVTASAATSVAGDANAVTTERSYKNKALAGVSFFTVVEPSALVFEGVANAEAYYLTIDCGNAAHDHDRIALGTATNYNFVNCPMQEGGIRFTVTAEAEGYAPSVSKEFVYNRELARVSGLVYDAETETVYWDAVADAMSYVVSVSCGDAAHATEPKDIGNVTSYSIKDCAAGEVVFSIYPRTKGYNSPVATTLTVEKATLAAPSGMRVNGSELTWNAVSGATGYTVRINGTEYRADGNAFDLTSYAAAGEELKIAVRAEGSVSSQWSDEQTMQYLAMSGALHYGGSELTWNAVVGATYYEVRVNDGEWTRYGADVTSAEVELTQAGENRLYVRFGDTQGLPSTEEAETTAYAYTIEFDVRGGSAAVAPLYVAYGDKVTLPVPESAAYDFAGWYNVPGGAQSNGAEYTDTVFTERNDLLLYAYWHGKTFTVTYSLYGGAMDSTTAEVVYGEPFKLDVPVNTDERDTRYAFAGWYTSGYGEGTRCTDEAGNGLGNWDLPGDVTLHAYWAEVLTFVPTTGQAGEPAYTVEAGPEIDQVTSVTIPATFRESPVTDILSGAFSNCDTLVEINIPNSIRTVGARSLTDSTGAFSSCDNLMDLNVYEVEGSHEVYYLSVDGILLVDSPQTGMRDVAYFPTARTGVCYIPDGVEEIPTRAFANAKISMLVIPSSVLYIRQAAFYNCDDLETVLIESAGEGAQELLVEDLAFQNCDTLKNVTLPTQLAEVNSFDEVFYGCDVLENITVEKGNAYYSSLDGFVCDSLGEALLFSPNGKKGDIAIPGTITAIGARAFAERDNLTSVSIGAYVESIGEYAFEDCRNLTSVTFLGSEAANATAIGNFAFYNCVNLASVKFEANSDVASIGENSFAFCESLEEISIPTTISSIGIYAFQSCVSLSEITIEGGDQELEVGDYAFSECDHLTTVNLAASVADFNFMRAFNGCNGIETINVDDANKYFTDVDGVLYNKDVTEIIFFPRSRSECTLPDTVTAIGESAFAGNILIESISISENVTEIKNNAFYGCQALTDVRIAEGDGSKTLTFGDYAFAGCSALTSISLPDRLSGISAYAFYADAALSDIELGSNLSAIGSYAFAQTAIEEIDIPDTVSEIGANAFDGCLSLIRVAFPSSMKVIGSSIFSNCPALSEVEIPEGVTEIGASAFEGCYALSQITLPSTLMTIGESAFARTGIVNLVIPKSVTLIKGAAFAECASLQTVVFEEGGASAEPLVLEGDPGSSDSNIGIFYRCSALTSVSFSSQVQCIGSYAFYWNTMLSSVTFGTNENGVSQLEWIGRLTFCGDPITELVLPEGLKETTFRSFYTSGDNMARLQSVVIPSTMEVIAEDTFYGQINLKSVTFTAGGREELSIDDGAFYNNTSLKEIAFPENLSALDAAAFEGCTGLSIVTVADGNADFYSLDNVLYHTQTSDGVRSDTIVLYPSAKTGELVLPEYVTVIPGSAFEDASLTGIVLPEGVTEIGSYAFADSKIQSIHIPSTVTYIGTYAFSGCSDLTSVTFAENSKLEKFATTTSSSGISRTFEQTGITSIELPASLKELSGYLFYQCTALKTVTFAEGSKLSKIGKWAFKNCSALETVVLDDSIPLETINEEAFGDSGLQSIYIPKTVTLIETKAFNACKSLSDVTFSADGTDELEFENGTYSSSKYYGVFSGCSALTSITLPYRLETVSQYAFSECTSLKEINFAQNEDGAYGVKTISAGAFRKTAIESFVVPDSVSSMPTVTSYNNNTFSGCHSLVSVTLPRLYTAEFSYTLFADCPNLKEVLVSPQNDRYTSVDGVLYNKDRTVVVYYPVAREDANGEIATTYEIPYGTVTVGEFAFYHNYNKSSGYNDFAMLTEVSIPASVSSIEESAFQLPYLETVRFEAGTGAASDAKTLTLGVEAFANYSLPAQSLTSIVLPARLTSLGNYVFRDCAAMTSVTFEEGCNLKTIGTHVFYDCESLTQIDLPDSVTSIGANAFYNTGLTSIELPDGITTLPNYLFQNCEALTSVGVSDALTSIGTYVFRNCTSLTQFVIPDKVTSIGQYAFAGSGLTSVTIPDSVDTMGNYVFDGCPDLVTVDMSSQIESLAKGVFRNCTALKEVNIPIGSLLTTIDNFAFSGCSSLVSIELYSVTTLGDSVFSGCSSLETLTFYGPLTTLGDKVFDGCTKLDIVIDQNNTSFAEDESGILYNSTMTEVIDLMGDLEGEVVLPDSVTTIADGVFAGTGITKITLPAGVTEISANLFQNCENLTEVVILGRITTIGNYAFQNTALTSFTVGREVTAIGTYAFQGCDKLETVTFAPNGTEALVIADYAFQDCTSLTSVDLPVRVRNGKDASGYASNGIDNYAFEGCTNLTSVTFNVRGGETLTDYLTFGNYAFSNTGLTSFTMPSYCDFRTSGGTVIGANCFENCTALKTFTFNTDHGRSYYVGNYAFRNCTALESINNIPRTFGFGNSNCGTGAFQNCTSLKEITIPSGNWFTDDMFLGCTGLETVTIYAYHYAPNITSGTFEGCTSLKTVNLPANMTSIETGAFAGCTSLESFVIPLALEEIEPGAFEGCTSLTTFTVMAGSNIFSAVDGNLYSADGTTLMLYAPGKTEATFTVPSTVTTIADGAFANCTALTNVVLPASVTTVEAGAFDGWTAAQTITVSFAADAVPAGFASGWNAKASVAYAAPSTAVASKSKE